MMTRRSSRQRKTTTNRSRPAKQQTPQTLTSHIRELRRRLFWSVLLSIAVGLSVYSYHDFFVRLIMNPLGHQKLIYLTPAGGFNFVFMVTFYVTMLLMLPFFLYQIYAFIRPAIPSHTRRLSVSVALAATTLMAIGAGFGYIFAAPAGLDFLMHFAGDYVTPSLTADSYLSFILGYVFGIGALFELPLLLLFWHWIHPLTPGGLLKSERYLIVGAFIVAGVISPSPDALTQTIIAVPLIVVYQFGVIAVLISIRKSRKAQHKLDAPSLRAPRPVASVKPAETRPPVLLRPSVPANPPAASAPRLSVDGMMKTSRDLRRPAAMPATVTVPPRSRPLAVTPRPRLISDFGPPRRPAIDITR